MVYFGTSLFHKDLIIHLCSSEDVFIFKMVWNHMIDGFFFSVIRPQIRFCCSGQENEQQILIFSLYCLPLHPDEMVDSVEPSASAASVQPKGEATKETHSLFQSSYVGKIAVQHPSVSPPGSHALVNLLYPDILVSKCQPVFGDGV